MPEPKYNYLISTQEGQTFSIPEEEYERNKEKIFAKNPAGVWREQAWDANQQTNEWDNYAVTTSDGHQFAVDAAKFGSTRDKLFEKDPNARVIRYSPVKWYNGKAYDAQSAADAEAKMNAFFDANGAKMAEYERAQQEARQYDAAMDGGVSLLNPARKQVTGDYSAYESLRQERDAVLAEYFNNPFIREREERKRDYQEQMRDQADDMVSQTSGEERRHWRRAREMHSDAYKLYNAPNVYVKDVDGNNGFVKFFKSYGKGMGDTFSDVDFWSMGLTETSRNFDLRKIQRKLEKVADEKGSELTEADIDSTLSQAEKAELDAWADLSLAQYQRASTLSGAYKAGQGSAESLYFMAQFLLTQGAGNAIGKGLAKSTNALASYIGRSLMTEQALQRAMNPVTKGMSALRAAEVMNTAADITKNVVAAEKAVQKAGKVGGALLKFGDQAIARPVIQGAFHTLFPTQSPGLLQNISQKALETGGSDGIVPGHPEEGRLIGIGKAIGNGVLDYFIENWSESMGGALDLGLARGIENWGGSFGKIARWIHEAPTTEVLVSGGFNGLIGEMSEEWMGNAARMAFGLMSKEEFGEFGGDIFSKDKNKRDKAVESQLEMAASFGPMSLIGLGGSIRGARSKSKEYAKQRTKVEDILRSHGVTDDELKDIFNKNFDSTKEVAQKLSGYVESIVSADISDEQKASEYKEVLNLARLIGQSRTLAGLEEQQTKYDRTQMRQSISASAGRFWQSHESEVKDKNGEPIPIEQVRVVTLADGRRMYAIDNMEDGGVMAIDEATGEMEFISKDRLDSDEVTSDREMMLDDYLDERVKETKDSEEAQRMETERRQQLQHVKEEARSRGSINLGTEESPLNARIVAETAEGVILEYTDANGQAVQQSTTWTDVANRIGMPINVKTDEQLDEELAGRMDSADARVRQYKGIIPGTRLTASLETGEEGQTEEVGFSFESAYNDGGVVMLRGTDENGNPIEFSEEQVTNLDEALNGSRVDLSDTQEVGKTVRWTDKDGVEHSGTIYLKDNGNGVTLVKYGNDVITDVKTADIIDDTTAPVQEEQGAQDNTPRDFRGNPLPLKDDGSVDQKSLWNSDPEAWVRWNDAKREDGGANSSAYVQGAINRLAEQRQQKQEQYDAESDFDRRDAIEAELREMDNRLGALNAIQQEYARKAEQEQEEASAQQEETAPEATVEAAPAQETPTAPEGVPTHEQAGFESLEALEQSIEEEAASSQTPLSLEEETARIEAMAGELYNGQDNGQQTELDVHPDAEGVPQVPGVGGQAAQAGVAGSAREGEAVRDSDRIDDTGRDASDLRAEGNEVSGNAVPLDTVQGNDALAAERQSADAGRPAGAEVAPVVDEAAGVQGAEQQAPAEAGAESGGEVSDEVGAQFSRQTESGQEQDATVTPQSPRQQRRVQRRAKRWKKLLGDAVNVMESLDDIDASDMSDGLKARVKEEAAGEGKAAGWYDVSTGKAYIYLPNINSEGEVDQKIVHEVLSHKGLRGLFNGEEGWNAFLDSIWDQMSDEARKEYLRYNGKSVATPENRRAAADEFVAHVVEYREESRQDKTAWQRLVSRVKELLNDMLGSDTFSYSDTKEDDIDALISEALGRFVSERQKPARQAGTMAGGDMDGNTPIRFSISAIARGGGLNPLTSDENGNVVFTAPDGTMFDGNHPVTAEYLKGLPNTTMGYMVDDALGLGYIDQQAADAMWQNYADMLNASLRKGLAENGGIEALSPQWQWLGETVYKTVASNSDKQYSYSMDITRVCKKNEAVIKSISEMQKRLGYGISPAQVMDIYLATEREGYQVPCPVCYVFSRYIRNGQYATVMINGQRKYGDQLVDPSTLTEEQKQERIKYWLGELEKQRAAAERNAGQVTKAKRVITTTLNEIDRLGLNILNGKTKGKAAEKALRKIYALSDQYQAAMQVVAQSGLDGWITNFAIYETKNGWQLYEDSFRGFPAEMALDLRETATVLQQYPAIQRYRNTRGAAAGKEITFEADNALGEVAMMLGVGDLKKSSNYYQMAVDAADEVERKEMRDAARKRFKAAHDYAQKQSLRGGQRMWSWSDNIERLAPDVWLNMMQLQMLGGALQSYSKQLEGVNLVARMGGYVNGSLMGKGNGYRELADGDVEQIDGQLYVRGGDFVIPATNEHPEIVIKTPAYRDSDGKIYTLEFDSTVGIDPFGSDEGGEHHKGLFELNRTLDKAGNILVGMNDIHVRTAMADDRVYFIIPWHASGGNVHILTQMLDYLHVNTEEFNPKDYTKVQEEKRYADEDAKIPAPVVAFWESHKNEADYPVGINGGTIASGDGNGNLSDGQRHYRELRDAIFLGIKQDTGKKNKDGDPVYKFVPLAEGHPWMDEIRADAFLSQVLAKVRSRVDSGKMTSTDTQFIYPYEYWNEGSKYDTADENGARYLEYCRRLGCKPKFVGKLDGKEEGDYGNFADDRGYWKLLIDRRMYDINGNFQDLDPVRTENFDPRLVDPEETAKEFDVTRVADDAAAGKIADRAIERESGRPGGLVSIDYDQTLDDAVKTFDEVMERPVGDAPLTDNQRKALAFFEQQLGKDFVDEATGRESSDDGTDDLIRHSFAGTYGALALDKANLESFRMDNLETAKAMEDTDATPKEIKMATGWERAKDGKWRYEIGDAYVNDDVFGEIAYLTRIGRQPRLSDIIDPDSEVMRAYPQLADVKVTAKTVKGEYGHANRRGNTINLSEGEIVKASDPVKILKQTINHEIQHFIQGYEGFAVGANSGLNVNNSESLAKAKEETPLVYGFIRYFGGTSSTRLINAGAQNARTSLSNYVSANNIVGEDLEMARALARELAHMEPGEYGKLVRDSKALLKKAKKEANDNYRKSAGEVEARNVSVRMPLNAEQRRILTAEETEDVAREEQVVRFSKVTDKKLIEELESSKKVGYPLYRAMQLIDGKLYPPMAAAVEGKMVDPIPLNEWEQSDERPDLAIPDVYDKGPKKGQQRTYKDGTPKYVFNLDKGQKDARGKKSDVKAAYNPYIHSSNSLLNDQFSSAWARPNLVVVRVEVPESEETSGYRAEKAKDSVGAHDWKSGPVSNALRQAGRPDRKVFLSRYDKPVEIMDTKDVADGIASMLEGVDVAIPFNTVSPALRDALVERGVKIGPPEKGNAGAAAIPAYNEWVKNAIDNDIRFSITPEQDREYMRAVEGGDMEAAQRLVDQAARFAFPNSTVKDANGNLLPVYHDTNSKRYVNRETGQDWESLDWKERDAWEQRDDWDQHWEERDFYTFDRRNARTSIEMPAFFFATEEDPYHEYGERTIKAYINLTNPVVDPVIENAGVTNTAGADAMQKYIDEGYDGFVRIDEDGKPYEYGVFDANNIKSAEPVTYDDNGDVIPLSERFNPEEDDIRFSKANGNQRVFISNAEAALDGIQQQKATPEQWLKMLEGKGGLKAGEDKWLGLSDWIREQDKKSLTKQEIADYIAENRIQIEEVKYAEDIDMEAETQRNIQETIGKGKSLEDLQAEIDEIRDSATRYDLIGEDPDVEEMDQFLTESMAETYGDDFKVGYIIEDGEISYNVDPYSLEEDDFNRYTSGTRKINYTRLGYTTEGLDNKREIALTVPTIEPWNEDDQIHFGDAGEGRAVAWIRFGDANVSRAKDDAKKAYEEADKAFQNYQQELKNKYALKATGTKSVRDLATDEENARLKELYRESNQKFNDWKYGRHARERVLVIDEIQSKRHQEGREEGYVDGANIEALEKKWRDASDAYDEYIDSLYDKYGGLAGVQRNITEEENKHAEELNDASIEAANAVDKAKGGIPDAPFEKNWHELAMKRMLRLAAEEGYDYVAWTTGEQQAERYNLGGAVDSIEINDKEGGLRDVTVKMKDAPDMGFDVSSDGHVVAATDPAFVGNKMLSDYLGKDLANRVMSAETGQSIDGDGLRIGGDGMKGFYDDILPRFMNKYGKKWGVKVDDMFIDGIGEGNTNGLTMHAVPVNEAMKESVMEGQVMFSKLSPVESSLNESNISFGNPDAIKEYHLSALDLSKHGDVVTLSRIVAEKPGRGEGTRFMEDLAGLADRNGWTLALTPDDSFGATSVSRLKKFYKRFGFKENKGRETDYSINESMIRRPAGDNGENALTRRKANADAVAAVDRDGITGLVGEENELDFYKSIVDSLPSELRSGIMDIARTNGFDIKAAAKEYIAAKAAMGLENDPTGELALFSNILRYYTENGELMDDSTARYALWKSGQESGIMTDLASAANKNRWGVGREEDDDVRFSKGDLSGDIAATRAEISNVVEDAATEKTDKRRALTKDLLTAARAMAVQKEYDQKTIDIIVNTARTLLKDHGIDEMTRREVSRLLGIVRTSEGKSQAAVRKNGDRLVDLVLEHLLKNEREQLDSILKIRGSKTNTSGVEVQGALDVRGQNIIKAFRAGKDMRVAIPGMEDGEYARTLDAKIKVLESRIEKIDERIKEKKSVSDEDEALRKNADDELSGLLLAREYAQSMKESMDDEADLRNAIEEAKEKMNSGEISPSAHRNIETELKEQLRENLIGRIESYRNIREKIGEVISTSRTAAKDFLEREKERRNQIRHYANSDLEGLPVDEDGKKHAFVNTDFSQTVFSPLGTLENILKMFGRYSPSGRGYLYDYFYIGARRATDNEIVGKEQAYDKIDGKCKELFGCDFKHLPAYIRKLEIEAPLYDITYIGRNGKKRTIPLPTANALYIYMVNKMSDGRMKLRAMGISESDVKKIEGRLDPSLIKFADWVQGDFLVGTRNKYNAVHERIFGAPMAAIENYFPLRIDEGSIQQQENFEDGFNEIMMPSAKTGAIIKRVRNIRPIDIENADAIDILAKHIDEMEHWAAWAEWNRDSATLLSYNTFKNRVKGMHTVLGTGKALLDNVKKAFYVTSGLYTPKRSRADRFATQLTRGVVTAKVALRLNTAIKQIESIIAFIPEVSLRGIVNTMKNPFTCWNWAVENMPSFRARISKGNAGNEKIDLAADEDMVEWYKKLITKAAEIGLWPNKMVDALTVAVGSKAVYESALDRYQREGFDDETAKRKAIEDAETTFNATQQSSESAFLSPIQVDRDFVSASTSVFRNSNFAYGRRSFSAVRRLAKRLKINGEERASVRKRMIEFEKKKLVREGLTEEQAEIAATNRVDRQVRHDIVEVAVFEAAINVFWSLMGNMWYLLLGDDPDEKEKMLKAAATHMVTGFIEGLSFGNLVAQEAENWASGKGVLNFAPHLAPIMSDLEMLFRTIKNDKVKATNDIVNLAVQIGLGTNPQTITDVVVAIEDALNGDLGATKEFMYLLMRIAQIPQSQIKGLWIDEINMSAEDAKKLTPQQLAERYAEYQLNRETPITGWMYSDEKRKKKIENKAKKLLDAAKK